MFEDSDPGDVTTKVIQTIRDNNRYCRNPYQPDIPIGIATHRKAQDLFRDRDALISDNARKLAEICALKEQLAALQAPAPEKPSFPLRALRHRHQAVGIFVPACFRG